MTTADAGGQEPDVDGLHPDAGGQEPDADAVDNPGAASMRLAPGTRQWIDLPRRTGVFVDAPSLRAHVGDLLRTYLGGYQVDAWGNITFAYEGARIFVTVGVSPIGPQVGVFSITNLDIDFTSGLAQFLLTANHDLGFGAFSYDAQNNAIWLRHTLLGTALDPPELQAAVAAIASTAAHFDDLVKERFGGRTFNEAPPEVQEATGPPPPTFSGYL